MRLYYTLFTREDDQTWYPQFGDFDRKAVKDEVAEYRPEYSAKNIKIVKHYYTDVMVAHKGVLAKFAR
jgi:thiamine pyrophosphokinase